MENNINNFLENLDTTTFVEIFDINDIEDSIAMMEVEFVLDYLNILSFEFNPISEVDKAKYYSYLISKYSLFIYQLESIERYEKCAEFKLILYNMLSKLILIDKEKYDEMLNTSILNYKQFYEENK